MAILGMENEERQILTNQYAIMMFLLDVHTKDMNGINECTFKLLQQSMESTRLLLEENSRMIKLYLEMSKKENPE